MPVPERRSLSLSLLAAILLLASSCGEDAPREEDPKAPVVTVSEPDPRVEAARARLEEAGRLIEAGKTKQAKAAIDDARALIGETTEIVLLLDRIREEERKLRHESEYAEISLLVRQEAAAGDGEKRLALLRETKGRTLAFLCEFPESPYREEVEASRDYATRELTIHKGYDDAIRAARSALLEEKYLDAVEAARKALAVFTRPEPREILERALERLTPEGMVFLPGGYFLAGRDRVRTWLPGFYIDRTEVTNAQYHEFIRATGHEAPQRFADGAPREGEEHRPVTYVTLADALAYARWAEKKIPTELQWERAARGKDGRAYPWGEEWDPAKGHFAGGGTVPVGTRPHDRSPEGVMDMGGNVMEMTLPLTDPAGESAGPVMKGGHWSDDFHPEYALTFGRWERNRDHRDSGSGFRCVRAAP